MGPLLVKLGVSMNFRCARPAQFQSLCFKLHTILVGFFFFFIETGLTTADVVAGGNYLLGC